MQEDPRRFPREVLCGLLYHHQVELFDALNLTDDELAIHYSYVHAVAAWHWADYYYRDYYFDDRDAEVSDGFY